MSGNLHEDLSMLYCCRHISAHWDWNDVPCLTACLSFSMYERGFRWTALREIWYSELVWNCIQEFQNLLKSGRSIWYLIRRPKYVVLLPATSYRHKSVLFEWNVIRLLEYPRGVNITRTRHNVTLYVRCVFERILYSCKYRRSLL
jgi:hypothetical protein